MLTISLNGLLARERRAYSLSVLFFFNATATTEIYTLSLHDALPIYGRSCCSGCPPPARKRTSRTRSEGCRSEEHTSELQSQSNLVCRLLLEKKKTPYESRPRSANRQRSRERQRYSYCRTSKPAAASS